MRINKFVASSTGMSRRAADAVIAENRITINGSPATAGSQVQPSDDIMLDGRPITGPTKQQTIILNKPVGYVVSRDGQGSRTIYDLLPVELHGLKPVGRLDKDSSGLLLLTDDGELAHQLTHPSFQKEKVYEVVLDKPLSNTDVEHINKGVSLEDGLSTLKLSGAGKAWTVIMHEGRNRQIRRTFAKLGYTVKRLHRLQFGPYKLEDIGQASYIIL